jgi:hypothetical protein
METAPGNATTEGTRLYSWRDVILFVSVMPLLWGLSHADWTDRFALVLLLLGASLLRFVQRPTPLSNEQLGYYLAFWFTTLDALDKFGGYGEGESWDIASFGAGVLVFTFLAWHISSSRRLIAAIPLLLLFVPLSQVPLDLTRNLIARSNGSPLGGVFVTKTSAEKTYGVFFDKPTKVRYILWTDEGEALAYDNDTTGLGAGTMPPQYSRASNWQRKLVQVVLE